MEMDMGMGIDMDMDIDMRRLVLLDQIELTCSVPLSRFTEIQYSIKFFLLGISRNSAEFNANSNRNSEERNKKILVEFRTNGIP